MKPRKLLPVPHFPQGDNVRNPSGSCNVTSLAMCLVYFGYPRPVKWQLEDELYEACTASGLSRHSPGDLAELFNRYAKKARLPWRDRFNPKTSIPAVKKQIDAGIPAILHGYFTTYGHIVVVTGYDDGAYNNKGGLLVNDPWGEWPYEPPAGSRGPLGKAIPYSYTMIKRTCCDNNVGDSMWVHLFTKVDD